MRLTAFRPDRAGTVSSWATDPTEVIMWCGHRAAPVPPETIRGWADEDGVLPYGFHDDAGTLIGYGELWIDDDEAEVELARLIVAPAHRGRGVGRALVGRLGDLARGHHHDVFLRVHPDNAAALRCYVAAGLRQVSAEQQAEWNAPQPVAYVWLRLP